MDNEEDKNKLIEENADIIINGIKNTTILPDDKFYKLIKLIATKQLLQFANKASSKPLIMHRGVIKNNILTKISKEDTFLVSYIANFDDYDEVIIDYLLDKHKDVIDETIDSYQNDKITLKAYASNELKDDVLRYLKYDSNIKNFRRVPKICIQCYKTKLNGLKRKLDVELLRSGDAEEREYFLKETEKYKEKKNKYAYYDIKEEVDYNVDKIYNSMVKCYINGNSKSSYQKYASTFMDFKLKEYSKLTKERHYNYYKKDIINIFNSVVNVYIERIKDEEMKGRFKEYSLRVLNNYIESGSYGNYEDFFVSMILNYNDDIQKEIDNKYYKRLTK